MFRFFETEYVAKFSELDREELDAIISGIALKTCAFGFKTKFLYKSSVDEKYDKFNLYIFRKVDNGIK